MSLAFLKPLYDLFLTHYKWSGLCLHMFTGSGTPLLPKRVNVAITSYMMNMFFQIIFLNLYTQNTLKTGSCFCFYISVSYHSCIRIRPLCASTLWPDGLIRIRIRRMYRVPHVDAQYYQILCTCSSSNWYRRLGRWSLLSRCNLFRNMRTLMAVRNNTRVLCRIWQLRLLSIMS